MKKRTKLNKSIKFDKATRGIIVLFTILTLLLMTDTAIYAQLDLPARSH